MKTREVIGGLLVLVGGLLGLEAYGGPARPVPARLGPPCSNEPGFYTIVVPQRTQDWVSAINDQLVQVAGMMRQHPQWQVRIEAHTGGRGSGLYNLRLSQQRANMARQHLIRLGIVPKRLLARGYGKQCPVVSNRTQAGRQKNSRLVFAVDTAVAVHPPVFPRIHRSSQRVVLYFVKGSQQVSPHAYGSLQALARTMQQQANLRLRIEGHQDATESGYGLDISRQRAQAILNFLRQQGIEPQRLEIRAYGPTRPIDSNRTSAGRARNRRVEIHRIFSP